MGDAVKRLAFSADTRTGEYVLWQDSASSLRRLAIGLGISALAGLCLGIAAGTLPLFGAPLSPLLTVLSMVPPLAILPILFIVFGLGELSKVMLIVIGITPALARDLEQRAREIPVELLVKAQTLGASTWTLMLRVVLPQLLPRLLISLRLMLGSAWLFLIAAEAIASTDGLGYRIFLVRRYLAMDVILPYVVWITLLAWLMDWGLKALTRRAFPCVNNVWQRYGDQVVLERLNLHVAEGEFCTLVGTSGCGKSTFLRLLLGQETASHGEILLDGKPLAAEPDASRGVVFQRYSVFPHLTVLDNVALGLELPRSALLGRLFGSAKKQAREQAAALLHKVGLGHALDKYPAQLSGGMQQRLAIAQALIMKPRVLLLDEPFGALDPGIRKDMHLLLLELWRETRLTASASAPACWCSTRCASTPTPPAPTAPASPTTSL
eukprot:gene21977-33736_t